MNDALHAGAVKLFGRDAQLGLGSGNVANCDGFPNLANLGFDGRLRGPIFGAALQALPMTSFGALGVRHSL